MNISVMKSILKYSLAIPVFAAVFLVAITALPAAQQQANALPENIYPWTITQSKTYVIHISSGDDKSSFERHSSLMGVQHAKAFQDSGKDVIIFLDVNGVKLIDDNHPQSLNLHYDTLEQFINDGGRVIACQHCIIMHDVDNMLPGVEIDNHPTMPKLQKIISSASVVLDY